MRIYQRKGSPNWWATWYQDGKRHRRSTGTDDRKLAQSLISKWVQEEFLEEHHGKKPELPFSDALLNYAKAKKRDSPKHFMDKTRYRIKYLAARFEGWNVSDFTYRNVQTFIDERLETVSSAMCLADLAIVRAAINMARREERTDFVPNFPKLKPSKPRNRWLTHEEEDRLVEAAADHLKPLVRFAVDTGGRRSELLGLDWREVDLSNRRVLFKETKNGEDRSVRLCERAYQTLLSIRPKDAGPVFTWQGHAMHDVNTSFQRARRIAGLEDVRFHDLRHTFASRLVQGGVPLYEVMNLTGHKSLSMVQRYAHLSPEFQEAAIRVLDARPSNNWHDLGTLVSPEISKMAVSH